VGAYAFLFFSVDQELSIPVSAVCTSLCMALVGVVTMAVFINPIRQFSTLLPFVTTLALASMLEALVSIAFGVNVRSLSSGADLTSWELGGVFITPIQILIIVSALIILGVLGYVVHLTGFGRTVRALSENTAAAQSIGIRAQRIHQCVFIVGTAIKAFAAMILGGLGSMWGAVAGSYILGLVENLAIGLDFGGYSLPAGYKDAFAFVIILGILLVRPQGLFGVRARSS
jgi:branched-chain amino acid transport system permease protein